MFSFYNVTVTLNLHTFEQVKLRLYKAVDAVRLVNLVNYLFIQTLPLVPNKALASLLT